MCLSTISTARRELSLLRRCQADASKITRERGRATVGTLLVASEQIELGIIGLVVRMERCGLGLSSQDRGVSRVPRYSLCSKGHRSLLLHELLLHSGRRCKQARVNEKTSEECGNKKREDGSGSLHTCVWDGKKAETVKMDSIRPRKWIVVTMEPNYQSMYLADLKLIAKTRRIKMYYVKTKEELIRLLRLPELPLTMRVEKMTIHQLRAEAKRRRIAGFWELRRDALVELLFPKTENVDQATPDEYKKDEGKTHEHHEPEEHDPKEVGV
jgi:hypothetical protein